MTCTVPELVSYRPNVSCQFQMSAAVSAEPQQGRTKAHSPARANSATAHLQQGRSRRSHFALTRTNHAPRFTMRFGVHCPACLLALLSVHYHSSEVFCSCAFSTGHLLHFHLTADDGLGSNIWHYSSTPDLTWRHLWVGIGIHR